MEKSSIKILKVYPESFKANIYSRKPFRMIGVIDASLSYHYGIERVTLAYFRSSGTNSGKIKGLWYPIVGIKTVAGRFTEFTEYLNFVLTNSTRGGEASEGWLAKSLFFLDHDSNFNGFRGFSNGKHYESLMEIGKILRYLYEKNKYLKMYDLDAIQLNKMVSSLEIFPGNNHTQRENFERFVKEIFMGVPAF